jgi:hypothetical protein
MLGTVRSVRTFRVGGVRARREFMVGLVRIVITPAGGARAWSGGDTLPDSLDGTNGKRRSDTRPC